MQAIVHLSYNFSLNGCYAIETVSLRNIQPSNSMEHNMDKSLVIGIDIGHYSIKAVALKSKQGAISLESYQELPIEANIFSNNHTVNYQKIVKKLRELRKALPLFSRKVALAIPDEAVISKILQIDSGLEKQEKEYAISQAFSQQSHFPMEDLALDFVEINSSSPHQAMTSYQVYATKRLLIDDRVNTLTKAGYQPVLFDLQAHCLIHIWQMTSRKQRKFDWLMVDVGLSQTSVCIDFSDTFPFCKHIALGTQFLNDDVQFEVNQERSAERFHSILLTKLQNSIIN